VETNTKKSRKKAILLWIGIILIILLVLGGAFIALTNLKQIHLYLNPVNVAKGTIRTQIVFPGAIDFDQHVVLQFQQVPTNGIMISWVGVKVGDHVNKNQLLASLDQQAILKQQQLNLGNFLRQRYTFDQTTSDNGGRTSDQAISDTQKRLLQQNQIDLNTSVFNVELQDVVQRLSNLWSPIDGIVTRVDTPVAGVNIQTADEAKFEVINPTTVFFNANIDETEINNLHVGDKGIIILSAYPAQFIQATIKDIAFASHLDANNNTVYTVKLSLANKTNNDYSLKFGMNGNVVFYEYADNILYIPNDYIHQDDNGSYVMLGKSKRKIYVQTGISDGSVTEIVKGLAEGEAIYY
jgi:multidrug efflux pump subunit AcrA (membrane-fusion protein)